MFDNLSDRLQKIFKTLKGEGRLNEENISEALRQVRLAMLEADVNFKVVKTFIDKVKERSLGQEVLESLTPAQQMIKIFRDEMIGLFGTETSRMDLSSTVPAPLMITGLQGSGKTTTCGKLALWLAKENISTLLVPADVYRPAAIEQLRIIGKKTETPVFSVNSEDSPVEISRKAMEHARDTGFQAVLLDTAGRLHIDDNMMKELVEIKNAVKPTEILFVADSMTGQDAVNSARIFNEYLDVTGVILTKLDGDARGGAALSIKKITRKPIKFVGIGEGFDALEQFHPDRMTSRILGMGDILSFIEKAEEAIDVREAKKLEEKIRKESFTLADFLGQLKQIKKMGPLDQLMHMIPGIDKLKGFDEASFDSSYLQSIEAIINSMTPGERKSHTIINGSRRKRIARGSGTTVQEVNNLLKQFGKMQKMMKNMGKLSKMLGSGKQNFSFPRN